MIELLKSYGGLSYVSLSTLHIPSLSQLLLGFVDICYICYNAMLCLMMMMQGQNGSHFEPKPVMPPLPNKCDWEIDPTELDFSNSVIIGKVCFSQSSSTLFRLNSNIYHKSIAV